MTSTKLFCKTETKGVELMSEKRNNAEMFAEYLKKLPAEKQKFVNGYI